MDVTADNIYFFVQREEDTSAFSRLPVSKEQENQAKAKDRKWQMIGLLGVQQRSYLLSPNALEFFFADKRAYLFSFPNRRVKDKILKTLRRIKEGFLAQFSQVSNQSANSEAGNDLFNFSGGSPQEIMARSGWTEKWIKGEIGNFEYLVCIHNHPPPPHTTHNNYFPFWYR